MSDRDAWVDIPSEGQVRELVGEGHPYDFGFLPNMARLAIAHPKVGPAFAALFGAVMFGPGQLDREEREMIAAAAAAAQDCYY